MAAPHERREEFERVALPHFDALFHLARNLTRNRADAEDLVQDAFVRAFRFFDSYRPDTHVKAWLFRILRNTFINRYRAAKSRPVEVDFAKVEAAYEAGLTDAAWTGSGSLSAEQAVMHGVLDAEIQDALDHLSEEYRSVVWMALVEQLSYKEIAAALSIPIGTVMSRLHRGRKQLQAELLELARGRGIGRPAPSVAKGGQP